jgi:hypothetical protein
MTWDGKAQLRITPWPDRPVPLPLVAKLPSQLDPAQRVITPIFESGIPVEQLKYVELTGETYLQLEQVDLDDPDSILKFVNEYGPLGGWSAYVDLRNKAESRAEDPHFILLYKDAIDGDALWRDKREALETLATLPAKKRISEKTRRDWQSHTTERLLHQLPPFVETLDEFRFAAKLLRDLKTDWLAVREGHDPKSVAWRPSHLISDVLETVLHWFSPRLGMRIDYYPPTSDLEVVFGPPTEVVIEPRREPHAAPLYAICALELFNHIVDNAEYHVCANENCRRTFVYQHGRSEKGQRRTVGVLYCTPACARATAQREYRRRMRRAG